MNDLRLGVFIMVNEVLVQALVYELYCFRLHPGSDESGEVKRRVGVHVQFIMHQLIRRIGGHAFLRQLILGYTLGEIP